MLMCKLVLTGWDTGCSTHLPVWLWVLGSYQERCTQDWCSRSVVFVKAVRNQMVSPCVEWWCEMDNQATTPFGGGVPRRQHHRRSGLATLPSVCRPLVTPYYCRLGDLLCLYVSSCILYLSTILYVYAYVYFRVFFVFSGLFSFVAFSFSTLILLVGSFDL